MTGTDQESAPYDPPLLTRHEPLRGLTGKSGEKDPGSDKDPNEKDPTTDKSSEKDPAADKDPDEKNKESEKSVGDKDPSEKPVDGP